LACELRSLVLFLEGVESLADVVQQVLDLAPGGVLAVGEALAVVL
jgi:hypothetical protein